MSNSYFATEDEAQTFANKLREDGLFARVIYRHIHDDFKVEKLPVVKTTPEHNHKYVVAFKLQMSTTQLRSIVNVVNANREDVWDNMSVDLILGACLACVDSGEWGAAEPTRWDETTIAWWCDEECVALYQFLADDLQPPTGR